MKFGRNSITEKSGKYYEGKESKTQKKNQKEAGTVIADQKPDESALEKIEKAVKYLRHVMPSWGSSRQGLPRV